MSFAQSESAKKKVTRRERFLGEMEEEVPWAEAFTQWTQSLRQTLPGEIIALDGKTLRRSGGGAQSPVHLVSAWAVGNRLVLGQLRTAEKSNERSGAR